jgi:hypothetical protein
MNLYALQLSVLHADGARSIQTSVPVIWFFVMFHIHSFLA